MRYDQIDKNLFVKNRQKLAGLLKHNSLAIVNSNDEMLRNGDQFYPFRQNSDLFYLTGIDQEKTILAMCPDHFENKFREILFIVKTNDQIELWNGHKLSKDEAASISGIKNVMWIDDFDEVYSELKSSSEYEYLNLPEGSKHNWEIPYRDMRYAERVKAKFPIHKYERLSPLMVGLRVIKERQEIDLVRKACEITGKAFQRVLSTLKPGVAEYQIEADIIHEFLINRASGHSFQPIVASGKNACTLHYGENNDVCRDQDLLLIDFGAEYANYAADCSRTIPVNGKFTPRQLQLYEAVLRVMKQSISAMVPGTTLNELKVNAGILWESEHIRLGLYTEEDVRNQNPEQPLWKSYFPHGVSHFLGLDVHDVGSKSVPLEPGMILTCEPGIYIPEEKTGIRLETNILITSGKPIDLMEDMPIEPDEIEKSMAKS
jgi:Xaa-Pro aminopeptidase